MCFFALHLFLNLLSLVSSRLVILLHVFSPLFAALLHITLPLQDITSFVLNLFWFPWLLHVAPFIVFYTYS